MKLDFVHVSGFRGYQKPVRIEFSDSFTVIDGRNGVGKSTIFDAVEFALTGTINKYLDAKSGRESVADYLWWTGKGETLSERFVEVGFRDAEETFVIRRTPLDGEKLDIGEVAFRLIDPEYSPSLAITQLCTSTIIRDEHIARFSLDLKEGDRFALLRDAIGAVDAESWIRRAQSLAAAASSKLKGMQADAEEANLSLTRSQRQLDQAKAALPAASMVSQATRRLQEILRSSAPPEQISDIGRKRVAEIAAEIENLKILAARFEEMESMRLALPDLEKQVVLASEAVEHAQATLENSVAITEAAPISTAFSEQARQLETLVTLGRNLGLRDGHCPLCASGIDHAQFEHGLDAAISLAHQLDAQAVEQARRERARDDAQIALEAAEEVRRNAVKERNAAGTAINDFDARLLALKLSDNSAEYVERRISWLDAEQQEISAGVRAVDTMSLDRAIERALSDQKKAKDWIARAEAQLGRARRAESQAKAIYDAARRASAETLDQRLERVLPLMSELYKRLRPHPIWRDIEYSVRGDVQRFMKLQVGGDINPQFVFSSGQRRATGLAFLLSVNLAITWSRWRSILLDDPVQHVDDFRTVHLAEVLGHLCSSGRQIVCAVEDSALADLMSRRLPTTERAPGKRITLGTDHDGALGIVSEQEISPLNRRVLVLSDDSSSARGA